VKPRGKSFEIGKGPTSIQDVADAAQVSIATVSRVLNNPSVVSAATAAKVREVIDKLGYVPNPFAQGLITRESRVLCFALPDMYGEFYGELIRGADAQAAELGYHLLVASNARGNPLSLKAGRSGIGLGLADGLAVMITDPESLPLLQPSENALPMVVIDVEAQRPGVDCVVIDNAAGASEATQHLLTNIPPERIFFVGGSVVNFDTRHRADAFIAVLKASGHTAAPDQLSYGMYNSQWGTQWFNDRGIAAIAASGPIGIFAANDEIAIGVLHAAEDAGLEVGKDLLLIGFDDTKLASLVRPALSSVQVPLTDIGAAAIRLLAQRIDDPTREPTTIHLATKLIIRASSQLQPKK